MPRSSTKIMLALSFLLGAVFFFVQWNNSCCDATQYVSFADGYLRSGIFSVMPGTERRTIGYISLLALVKVLTLGSHGMFFDFVVFVLQWVFYVTGAVALSKEVEQRLGYGQKLVLSVLLTNVLLLPFIGITLTESVYVSLFVWWLTLLLKSNLFQDKEKLNLKFFTLANLVAGGAMILRPAAVWLLAGQVVLNLLLPFIKKKLTSEKLVWMKAFTGGGVALAFFPFLQALHNYELFGHFTALPHFDLGSLQYSLGLRNIKYDTFISATGRGFGVFYKNVLFNGTDADGLAWYFQNPMEGIQILALKLVSLFDFHYLFTYVTDESPWYGFLTRLYGFTVLVLGLAGIALSQLRTRRWLLTCLAVLLFVFWTGPVIFSAVEVRFGIPMITYLGLFSVVVFDYLRTAGVKPRMILAGVYLVALILLFGAAGFIDQQRVLG